MKQIHRLESQRSRLFKKLEKKQETSTVLSIEKMILDVDTRMMSFVSKTIVGQNSVRGYAIKLINQWTKEKGMKINFMESGEIVQASEEAGEKIYKILKEDREKKIEKM